MNTPTLYTKGYCGYYAGAKALLEAKHQDFGEIDVTQVSAMEAEMITRSGRRTAPQIFIGNHHIGGYDELAALEATGELDELLGRVTAPTPTQPTRPIGGTANV
jgi:GrxC family glutaredoxin